MFRPSSVSLTACVAALTLFAAGCGSPETPPSGTTPAPAANPPAAAAPAPAPRPAARSIEGYAGVNLSAELAGNLFDVERDLQNIVDRSPNAAAEFAEDVFKLGNEKRAARTHIDALSRELEATLPAATGIRDSTRRFSELLFAAVRGGLDDARSTQLDGDVSKLLVGAGVPEPRAKAAAGHVVAIARASR